MKRLLIIALIACVGMTSVFAKKTVGMLQGTVMLSDYSYVDKDSDIWSTTEEYPLVGITLSKYSGGFLGWFVSGTIATHMDQATTYSYYDGEEVSNYDLDLSETDLKIAGDVFLGPALFLDLFLPGAIVAGGIHTNIMHIDFTDDNIDDMTKAVLGAGVNATALVQLGPLNINATVGAYYDFMEYIHEPSDEMDFVDFNEGTTITLGVGVGLKSKN